MVTNRSYQTNLQAVAANALPSEGFEHPRPCGPEGVRETLRCTKASDAREAMGCS